MIVADLCLNSTFQSQDQHADPDKILATNTKQDSCEKDQLSGMSSLRHSKEDNLIAEEQQPPSQLHISAKQIAISDAEANKIINHIVPQIDLPQVVKFIKQQIPFRLKVAKPPEDPDQIVESTLQAISLTKQHQNALNDQSKQNAQTEQQEEVVPRPEMVKEGSTHLVVNSDINGLKVTGKNNNQKMLDEQEKLESCKALLDAIMLEQVN